MRLYRVLAAPALAATLMFSCAAHLGPADVWIPVDGLIDFGAGDCTITHSAGTLTMAGCTGVGFGGGATLPADPGAHTIFGWDDTGNAYVNKSAGTGLTTDADSVDFAATELSSVTWGAGSFTTEVFDAGATDPTWTYGSNSVALTNATTFTVGGKAIKRAGKQMMWIPASAMKNNVTSPASCGDTYDSGTADLTVTVCAFDTGATEERADFQITMPKSWDEGTVTAIPLTTSAAGTAGQTVQYEISCVAISNGDSLNAAMGTPVTTSATLPATPANLIYAGAETTAITCAGTPAASDYVAFRISRDTSVDNMTGDALLLGIQLFWTDDASTLAE